MSIAISLNKAEDVPAVVVEVVKSAMESTLAGICRAKLKPLSFDEGGGSAVVGFISFVGDLSWSFGLVLPEETAPKLALMFAGFEVPYSSADMGDVVGELANVVAGDIVAKMEAKRIKTQMSLPMVTRGRDVELMVMQNKPQTCLEFASDAGKIWCNLTCAVSGLNGFRRPGK